MPAATKKKRQTQEDADAAELRRMGARLARELQKVLPVDAFANGVEPHELHVAQKKIAAAAFPALVRAGIIGTLKQAAKGDNKSLDRIFEMYGYKSSGGINIVNQNVNAPQTNNNLVTGMSFERIVSAIHNGQSVIDIVPERQALPEPETTGE